MILALPKANCQSMEVLMPAGGTYFKPFLENIANKYGQASASPRSFKNLAYTVFINSNISHIMTFMELPSVRQAKILYISNIIIIIELKNVTSLPYWRNKNFNLWNSSRYQIYNTHRNNIDFSRYSLTAIIPFVSPSTHSLLKIQIFSISYMFRSSWKVRIYWKNSVRLHLAPPIFCMTKYSVIVLLLPKKSCSQLRGVNLDLTVRSLVPQ